MEAHVSISSPIADWGSLTMLRVCLTHPRPHNKRIIEWYRSSMKENFSLNDFFCSSKRASFFFHVRGLVGSERRWSTKLATAYKVSKIVMY